MERSEGEKLGAERGVARLGVARLGAAMMEEQGEQARGGSRSRFPHLHLQFPVLLILAVEAMQGKLLPQEN